MNTDLAASGALLTIDLDALCANWRHLRSRLAGAACAGVVKADAYGLGAERVAPALYAAGCRHFFVAHLDEAIRLQPHLPADAELFVLHGVPPGAERECVARAVVPVLNSLQQLDAYASLGRAMQRQLPAIVQLDSGMSRLGLSADEVRVLAEDAQRLNGLQLRYVMSHLACAEQPQHPANEAQRERFDAMRALLPATPASLANSSGIFLGARFQHDLVRPGAALYGIAPVAGAPNPMQPVVRLQGRVIQTRRVDTGTGVGYGLTWQATQPTRLATVSVGYADGFLRSLSRRAVAHAGGIELPLVGTVSMDTITLDVGALPEGALPPGSLVDLIGAHQTVDDVAARAGTIGYEILTHLGQRYARRYIGGAAQRARPAPFVELAQEAA
jgi:alanine racemase